MEKHRNCAVVLYDKDNDFYKVMANNLDAPNAIDMACILTGSVENGTLTNNGEPYDWVEVYANWDMPDEEILWASYKELEQER